MKQTKVTDHKEKRMTVSGGQTNTKFKYSLHVGDMIEYRRYDDKGLVKATVTKIGESNFITDERPAITTSLPFAPLTEHNPGIKILTCIHKNAPPEGKEISIEQVNLVEGNIREDDEWVEMKERFRARKREYLNNGRCNK